MTKKSEDDRGEGLACLRQAGNDGGGLSVESAIIRDIFFPNCVVFHVNSWYHTFMKMVRIQGSIPMEAQKYFWDANISQIDTNTHKEYIVSRILEYGDPDAARWLFRTYPKKDIVTVLKKSRSLSVKSGMFWALFLQISPNDLLCLKKSFRQLQKSHWSE